ncbi:MAG TPA: FecR domain-containing protein [Chitinophagaceae bacterium]|nr:FecR domain-containing protein [Chitinophagaceae bacterium]
MEKLNFVQLLDKYLNGSASEEEARLLKEYYRRLDQKSGKDLSAEEEEILYRKMLENIYEKIHGEQHVKRHSQVKRIKIFWYAAASILLVLLFSVGMYFFEYMQPVQRIAVHKQLHDITPGGNRALLTLSNGATIVLDSVRQGQLASQGNSKIVKADSGLLLYQLAVGNKQVAGGGRESPVQYNTLTTPRGGQYQLVLPDGSKVWLNSASSIHYPTAFTGKKRKVVITGEIYMEIAEDADHPFIVATRNSDITVLGTRFNVMAYDNEPEVKTTLLEGLVKVSIPGNKKTTIIKPGQQADVDNIDQNIEVKKVNADDVAAWIHGLLSLNDCSVQEFMNQLSRWYDVDIEYSGKIIDKRFGGTINRNAHLSDVLSALSAIGIHTKLEGKRIIVLSQ